MRAEAIRPAPHVTLATALVVYHAGLCVVAPAEDGTKRPFVRWQQYQKARPTIEQLRAWYAHGRDGIGLVTGAVSGNLLALDLDDQASRWQAFADLCHALGHGELLDRIIAGFMERTPSGGLHLLWRCSGQVRGNEKLARRLKLPQEMKDPGDKYQALIETRGEGGYLVVAPSGGRVHKSGNAYEIVHGGFESIATITPEQQEALLDVARSLNEVVERAPEPERIPAPAAVQGNRPGDVLAEQTSWHGILEPHGWKAVHERGGVTYWRRPGKDGGISATTGYAGKDYLYVFTTSTPFEPERTYSKFGAYVLLEHGGDYPAATRALAARGYGSGPEHRVTPPNANGHGSADGDGRGLPTITVGGFTRYLTAAALEALARQPDTAPRVFQRGGALVRLRYGEDGPRAEVFVPDSLRGHLDRIADWTRITKDGHKAPSSPPMNVVKDLLTLPSYPDALPVLRGIFHAPVVLPGGRILDADGYDDDSGLLLHLGDLAGRVRHDMRLDDALRLLRVELLGDFPFVDEGSRADALELLLRPFVRPLIRGLCPLTLIEAPTPATGKGLLAEVLLYPFLGRTCAVMPQPSDNDELRKSITSSLIQGEPCLLLDNVAHLKGAALSAALTAEVWTDRLLGQSKMLRLRNEAVWLATGNNVVLSTEQARRTLLVRLDAPMERPESRNKWRHPLPSWAREHRAELVSATLSIIQHWIARGMPRSNATLGRFEEWAATMGGILESAGVSGFLTGRDRLYASMDCETTEWAAFCAAWWETYRGNAVTAKDLLKVAQDADSLLDIRASRSQLAAQQRLGHSLSQRRDRVFGTFIIRQPGRDSGTGNNAYRLEPIQTPETPETPPDGGNTGAGNRTDSRRAGVSGVLSGPSDDRDDEVVL